MASSGLTQKQRLAQWEAWMHQVVVLQRRRLRWSLRKTAISIERRSMDGVELEKTPDDRQT
jgi:hypothetical protein